MAECWACTILRPKGEPFFDDVKYNTAYHSDKEFELDKDVSAIGRAGWLKPLVMSARETYLSSGTARSPTRVTSFYWHE